MNGFPGRLRAAEQAVNICISSPHNADICLPIQIQPSLTVNLLLHDSLSFQFAALSVCCLVLYTKHTVDLSEILRCLWLLETTADVRAVCGQNKKQTSDLLLANSELKKSDLKI